MMVRFIQQWGVYQEGARVYLQPDVAATLVQQGICVQIAIQPPWEVR